jgi:hypothetical protein
MGEVAGVSLTDEVARAIHKAPVVILNEVKNLLAFDTQKSLPFKEAI